MASSAIAPAAAPSAPSWPTGATRLKEHGEDPLGDTPTEEISKAKLDKMLASDDPVAAGLVHTVVEEFAAELATVVRRFLRLDELEGHRAHRARRRPDRAAASASWPWAAPRSC